MFAEHQPKIAAWGFSNPENFAKVQLLCILSARQRFDGVRDQFNAVMAGDERDLWGWKLEAWERARQFAYGRSQALLREQVLGDAACLALVAGWYGFGLIKGGFLLQLLLGRVGCIDSRNQDEFDVRPPPSPGDSYKRRALLARTYVRQCAALGSPDFLWDNWCAGYARTSGVLRTPWQVSAEHCRILGVDPGDEEIPF